MIGDDWTLRELTLYVQTQWIRRDIDEGSLERAMRAFRECMWILRFPVFADRWMAKEKGNN